MAAKVHRPGNAHKVKHLARAHKRPCRSAPAAPTGLAVEFLKREVHHREEWRARVTFNAVTLDVAGRPLDVERYDVQLRATDASGVPITIAGHSDDVQRESVHDSDGVLKAVFEDLSRPKTWYYQARVRTLNRVHGGKCWSAWTSWSTPTQPSSGALPGPPAPTGLVLRLDKVEGTRRFPWRASPKWNEIGTWTPANGDPIDGVTTYQVQLAVSKDGGTNTVNIRRASQPADPTVSTTHHDFFNARGRRHYRARVRAVDQYGRIGAYTSWTAWASPGGTPHSVENLTWDNPTPAVLVARWEQPSDPTDVDRYHVTVLRLPGLVVVDEGETDSTRWLYHIPPADRDNNHRVLVKSVEEEVSADVDDDVSVGFDVADASPEETSSDVANDQVWGVTDLDMDAIVLELPPAPTSDGDPPSASPTPTVVSGIGALFVRWDATSNADTVTYEVHISTSNPPAGDGTTKVAEIDGTAVVLRTTAAGAALAYGTTYYVALRAKDVDGTATLGTAASGSIVKVNTADIVANAVTVAELADNAVTAAKIATDAVGPDEIAALAVSSAELAALAVTTAKIAADAVTAGQLADDAVGTEHIQALAVTSAEVAASAITTAKIAADAVTAGEIAANAVGSSEIAALAVTTAKIAALAVTTAEIAADAITAAKLADDAVGSEHIQALAVTAAEVAANAITTAKIADDAVNAAKIAALAVGTAELDALAVTTAKIAADAVTSGQLADDAVGTEHLQALAVTAAEVAANAVTTAKIADDAVNQAKLAALSVGTGEIIALAVTAAQIAANTITAGKIAADTITAAEIAALAITTSELAAGAVTAAKIAADTITANEIAALAITTSELAAGAVTAAKIAADTITAGEIAANAVSTSELNALAVTAAKIAANTITAGQIAAATITTAEIAADTITAGNIAALAITTSELAAGAVTAAKIAADTITANEIAANAVSTSELNALAVTAAKIAADTITASEIAALAITTSELAAGAVTAVKIAAGTITANEIAAATITGAKIAADTITATEIAANAITTSELNALAVTAAKIAANTITAAEIAADAITTSELAANAVTAGNIAAGTIVAADIAANTITAGEIAASAITSSELAANAVIAGKILAGTIVAADIAADTITSAQIAASAITTAELAANAVTAAKIAAGTITATEIAAGTITANLMAADSIVASNIVAGTVTAEKLAGVLDITTQVLRAGNIAAQRVELDKDGLRLYGTDGASVIVELPTDSTKSSTFKGKVEATSLDVTGGATLRAASSVPRSGVVTLESVQQPPVSAPTMSWNYVTKALTGYTESRRGLHYDAVGGAGGATPSYLTVMPSSGGSWRYVREFVVSTGALSRELDLGSGNNARGVVRIGTSIYVLYLNAAGNWYITKYLQSTFGSAAYTAFLDVGATADQCANPAFATDGTDLFVVSTDTAGAVGNVKLYGYDTTIARKAGSDLTTNISVRPKTGPNANLRGAVKLTEAGINGGAAVWWLAITDSAQNSPDLDGVYAVSASTGNRVTGYDWETGTGGAPTGIGHNGSVFVTLNGSSDVYTHTNWKWDSAALSNTYWAAYSWYDSAGTTHETALSPRAGGTMRQRAGLTITWPAIPTGGADDPDSTRTYLKQNATDPGSAFASYYRQASGTTGTYVSLTTYSTATAGVQDTAFAAGTPGQVKAALAGFAPLQGNGDGFIPIGAIMLWGTVTAPTGWAICDGSSQLRAGTYAGLFAIIGTTFGTVDGTHFTLPDLRSRYPLGVGTLGALGATDGAAEASRTHRHTHGSSGLTTAATGNTIATIQGGGATTLPTSGHVHGISGNTGNSNLADFPFLALNYIIKL